MYLLYQVGTYILLRYLGPNAFYVFKYVNFQLKVGAARHGTARHGTARHGTARHW